MFQTLLSNLERPYTGPLPRGVWVGLTIFFAVELGIDLVRLSGGRGDLPDIALMACMLSLTLFLLFRQRLIRLLLYGCWVALLILSIILRIRAWLQ